MGCCCCSPPLPSPPPPPPPRRRRNPCSAAGVLTRRSLLLSSAAAPLPLSAVPLPDTTVTDRVFMEFSLCPNFFRPERTLADSLSLAHLCSSDGSDSSSADDSLVIGRLVLGLYGRLAPTTVAHFKSLCAAQPPAATYRNTLVHKVFPGQFLLAGRQGDKPGELRRPSGLPRNTDTVDPKAFALTHSRAGLLSLCLSENDDDDDVKLDPEYRNVEFLITTGPGPCPRLDNKNIVFGSVLEGLDVVTAIAAIPTYVPAEKIKQFNNFAEFLGDGRAQNARASWNRPLKTVYISNCGELQVAKPSLSPSLP